MASLNGYTQGDVVFANSAQSLVTDGLVPIPTGVLRVGLYYCADLAVIPDYWSQDDLFTQAGAFAPVGGILGPGRFSGGNRTIPFTGPTGEVNVQVRGWSAAFATYEEAFAAGMAGHFALVCMSNVMRITPASGTTPPPSITDAGLQSFWPMRIPEPSTIAVSILGGLGAIAMLRFRK